jgi:hypothetical protein
VLKPRLAWITVILKEPSEATVTIDGLVIPPAAIGVKRAADPGFPEVTVTAEGYEPFKQTVTVGSGEEKTVEVTLKKLPEVQGPEPRPSDAVYRARQSNPTRRILTYVAFGVGGAGVITGGVFGAMTLKKRSDLRSECLERYCRTSSTKKISTYHTYGTITAVAAGVGVLGLGTGLALLLTEPKPEQPPAAGLRVRPLVGLGLVGAEGSFQ